ncbi:MAG TPA: ABC transporter permease [Mucilaginibacter sp.]|nr:ABC transporter permease [Mucilaginibacter sp.]
MKTANLKLALRNIRRNKLYTFINITGLGMASAFCILIYLYVRNEQSFDSFHHDQDQLFRVEQSDAFASHRDQKPSKNLFSFLMRDAEQKNLIQTPTSMGPDLKRNFPEIESFVRFDPMGPETVKVGNRSFKEKDDNLCYVDADFFKVLNYPLVSGNAAAVISGLNQAAISQTLAKKYFGNADPVGKIITFPNETNQPPITVNGVFKDFPSNSSFQFDLVMRSESNPGYKDNMARGVNSFSTPLIIKVEKGTDIAAFTKKLDAFGKNYFAPLYELIKKFDPKSKVQPIHFFLRPLADAHYNESAGWGHYTDLKNIYQLVCLTVIILLIACLNYILLTLTNTISRSQDVGIRKTIGAGRLQIILQYYTETQLIAFFAVIFGFILSIVCLPFFGTLTGSPIHLANIPFVNITIFLLALALILGVMAGIYPALAMSGLKPLNMMRSFSAYKISPLLSRMLIIIQFTVCVILIISSLVINGQMHYINNANMGFDKDQVLVLNSPYNWMDKQSFNALKQRMYNYAASEPGIADISSGSWDFGGGNHNAYQINGEKMMLEELNVDFNFFSFMKIPIIKGRTFSPAITSDSLNTPVTGEHKFSTARHNMVVNETLYNLLGKPEVGVYNDQMGGVIIGVCKDYHMDDLTKKIDPAYYVVNKQPDGQIWVRIAAGRNIPAEMTRIKAEWNELTGNLPFVYTFLDQDVAKSYDAYVRWMATITASCIVAIILACLGLFGLSGLTTINRKKEIGIRKVLGASVSSLFMLVNRETFFLAITAFLIAVPVAVYFNHQWLDNFAYRIHPGWGLFAVAGLASVLTAVIAVSYHAVKASMANPVDSLRNE